MALNRQPIRGRANYEKDCRLSMESRIQPSSRVKVMVEIFILDPQHLTRVGLVATIGNVDDLHICGNSDAVPEDVEELVRLRPDLVLIDLPLLGSTAEAFMKNLKTQLPGTKLIVFTAVPDDDSLLSVLNVGAHAYIFKGTSVDQLTCALRAVHAGAYWMDPLIARRLIELTSSAPSGVKSGVTDSEPRSDELSANALASLSQRERQVLSFIVQGWGNKEIASELRLSRDTVKTHVRHILEKFCVKTRTEAAVRAMRIGSYNQRIRTAG